MSGRFKRVRLVKKDYGDGRKFDDVIVQLKKRDTDVTVTLPNGENVIFQFRLVSNDHPTLDICLPEAMACINWKTEAMDPAPQTAGQKHVRLASQICVELPDKVIGE